MLRFRVGIADEELLTHGLTHLVEHLALHAASRHSGIDFNGYTTLNTTTFVAGGERAGVQRFIAEVCAALQDLPLDRLADEVGILRTEEQQRPPSMAEKAYARRFGAGGYGLSWFSELGFDRATPDNVRAHAARYFNADNAVLVVSGSTRGFRAELPRGERHEIPDASPYGEAGWMWSGDERTMGLTWLNERGAASAAFGRCLERRLTERLRHEKSLVYGVSLGSERTGALSHAVVACGVLPEAAQAAVDETRAVIDALAAEPISRRELEDDRKRLLRSAAGAGPATVGWLDRAAEEWLYNQTLTQPADVIAQTAAVTPDSVLPSAQALLGSQILLIPTGTTAGGMTEAMAVASDVTVTPSLRVRSKAGGKDEQHLGIGAEGVTWKGSTDTVTYQWPDVVAWWRYSNNYRVYLVRSGRSLTIEPSVWRGSDRLIGTLDGFAPKESRIDAGEWIEDASAAPPSRNSALAAPGLVVLALFALLFLVSTISLFVDYTRVPTADNASSVAVGLVITAALGFAPGRFAWNWWRGRRT